MAEIYESSLVSYFLRLSAQSGHVRSYVVIIVKLNRFVVTLQFCSILPSFCKRELLKMFPYAKLDVFILRPCSRSGKIFKSLTRLVCELSIISINNFAKGNIFMLPITSQQLFFTIENLQILYAAAMDANNATCNALLVKAKQKGKYF